jgi:hypothetical protein
MTRYNWEDYKSMLEHYGYSEEQIASVKEIRENLELMPWEMYQELLRQGVLIRTQKLKKPRSLYVNEEGKILYLNHHYKKYNYCAKFKDEEVQ